MVKKKEKFIKWKNCLQKMKSCQGIDFNIERLFHFEEEKWRYIRYVFIDAFMYLATNCLSLRGSEETLTDFTENLPQRSQENFLN